MKSNVRIYPRSKKGPDMTPAAMINTAWSVPGHAISVAVEFGRSEFV